MRSTHRFGWCEPGFQEEHFVELMMREGLLVPTNFLPVDREGTVRAGGNAGTFRVTPDAQVPVTLAVPPAARYLEIIAQPVVPSSIIPENADRRELSVAVIAIKLR